MSNKNDKVVLGVLAFLGVLVMFAVLSVLGAYPTKWIVNYLFSPSLLFAVFGVARIGFFKAFALNLFSALLIKSTCNVKS